MVGLTAGVLMAGAAVYSQDSAAGASPWQVGRCYRVFPSTPDKFHSFRVLENPSNGWVRVEPWRPSSIPVPGGPAQAALWINTQSPFAVQEWSCESQD
jgi:hypothetical protein